jgi:hypothetical protein
MELANVELGVRLGLYEALAGADAVTAADLAARANIAERYAQEWLEQQAVAGVVEVDDAARPAPERRFTLPNAHAHVLAVSMQDGGVGTGTVIRPDTVRRYAADAGFSTVDVLDVDHPQFLLYQLA